MISYSSYEKASRSCIVLEKKSPCYKECVRRGLSRCDARKTLKGSLLTSIKEVERLKAEHDVALQTALKNITRVERL
jgi:hypothetical protein